MPPLRFLCGGFGLYVSQASPHGWVGVTMISWMTHMSVCVRTHIFIYTYIYIYIFMCILDSSCRFQKDAWAVNNGFRPGILPSRGEVRLLWCLWGTLHGVSVGM